HRDALPRRLAGEGTRGIRRRHRPLALIEHSDVTAQRNRTDDVFGVVGTRSAAEERPAEADGEAQDLESEPAGHPVVAELVDGHEEAHGHHVPQEPPNKDHARAPLAAMEPYCARCSCASRLASLSAAITSSKAPMAPAPLIVVSTVSMTAAIP